MAEATVLPDGEWLPENLSPFTGEPNFDVPGPPADEEMEAKLWEAAMEFLEGMGDAI